MIGGCASLCSYICCVADCWSSALELRCRGCLALFDRRICGIYNREWNCPTSSKLKSDSAYIVGHCHKFFAAPCDWFPISFFLILFVIQNKYTSFQNVWLISKWWAWSKLTNIVTSHNIIHSLHILVTCCVLYITCYLTVGG